MLRSLQDSHGKMLIVIKPRQNAVEKLTISRIGTTPTQDDYVLHSYSWLGIDKKNES